VLRLLDTELPVPHGGAVCYLAEVADPPDVALTPVDVDLSPHPHRAPYAEVGGPAATLDWAARVLGRPVLRVTQQRTWNLSAIWRLDTDTGPVWVKHVPHFFAHEPAVLTWIGPPLVPEVIATADGRTVLAHVPGEDLHDAPTGVRRRIAELVHPLQVKAAGHVDELLALGVPDRRAGLLLRAITEVAGDVPGLPDRLAAVAACGIPDTLVHGDLHPGNVRGPEPLTVIDWGDSFIGHPAFDILRLADDDPDVIEGWIAQWRRAVPGSDPGTALDLLRPVAALRNAAVYARFLANIEPSEYRYHAADVGEWLDRALR
jgi:Phosphotransferase enzyme family